MKKAILKFFGLAALAAGMMYNVQMSDAANGSDISLTALENVAVAQGEGGNGGCTNNCIFNSTSICIMWDCCVGCLGTRIYNA